MSATLRSSFLVIWVLITLSTSSRVLAANDESSAKSLSPQIGIGVQPTLSYIKHGLIIRVWGKEKGIQGTIFYNYFGRRVEQDFSSSEEEKRDIACDLNFLKVIFGKKSLSFYGNLGGYKSFLSESEGISAFVGIRFKHSLDIEAGCLFLKDELLPSAGIVWFIN